MNDSIIKKDVITFFVVYLFLFGILAAIKMYDSKTGVIDSIGSKIYSKVVTK